MISVEEAKRRICGAFPRLSSESVPVTNAAWRVLSADAIARITQPPFDISAMDGYAVRATDVQTPHAALKLIGEASAGGPFRGTVGKGEAVRIYTGAVVPEGADAVVMQEDTSSKDQGVTIKIAASPGKHVRRAGLDFQRGDVLATAGRRLTARDIALLAAGDIEKIAATRKPRVGIVATGDELARPGERRSDDQVVASSSLALASLVEKWGGLVTDLGILPDRAEAFAKLAAAAEGLDVIVTLGGASVGDHDLVRSALAPHGFELDFWKVAMRPGKPLIFGRLGRAPLLGLPGNPVSAFVCALVFLRPAMAVMLGESYEPAIWRARLTRPLKANDTRQDYVRSRLAWIGGELESEPLSVQDSSMQRALAEAGGLIVRPPNAPGVAAGETVDVLPLESC
ncbi:MAG: molybdopterin molybdotransferase MoeA [Alphaproteobacteria bacterium]